MGNKSSLMLQDDEIKQISDETGFSASQIEKLYARFAHLDRSNVGSLNRNDLLSIPELAINPLCDRLIQMFFADCNPGEDERINFKQFMKILSIFKSSSFSSSNPPTNSTKPITQSQEPPSSIITISKSRADDNNNNGAKDKNIITTNKEYNKSKTNNNKLNDCLKNKLLFVFRIYDADNDGKISFNDLRSILKMMVGNYIEDLQLDKIANRAFMEVDEDNDGYIEFREFCNVFSGKDLDDKLRVKFLN